MEGSHKDEMCIALNLSSKSVLLCIKNISPTENLILEHLF